MIQHHPKIVTNNLFLYLDPGNKKSYTGSGSSWIDYKNKRTTTLFNNPTYSSTNGGILIFNGSSNYMQVSRSIATNINGGSEMSFCFWYKGTAAQSILRMQYSATPYIVPLWAGGTSTLTFISSSYGTAAGPTIPESSVSDGYWHFICCVYKQNSFWGIYKDGILASTYGTYNLALPTFDTTASNMFDMFRYPTGVEYTNGSIGPCFIYNRALSFTEILQNYRATKGRFGL